MKLIKLPVSPINGSAEQDEIFIWINPNKIIAVQTPEEKHMLYFKDMAKFSNTSRSFITLIYTDSLTSCPIFVLLPLDKVLNIIENAN